MGTHECLVLSHRAILQILITPSSLPHYLFCYYYYYYYYYLFQSFKEVDPRIAANDSSFLKNDHQETTALINCIYERKQYTNCRPDLTNLSFHRLGFRLSGKNKAISILFFAGILYMY